MAAAKSTACLAIDSGRPHESYLLLPSSFSCQIREALYHNQDTVCVNALAFFSSVGGEECFLCNAAIVARAGRVDDRERRDCELYGAGLKGGD